MYWTPKHLQYYREFLKDQVEELYIQKHEKDNQDYWYEIPAILKDIGEFGRLLRMVSLSLRRRILLNKATTGMSRRDLERNFGVTRPRMNRFIHQTSKYERYDLSLISSLAILCRVPITWFLHEKITKEIWELEHFRYQTDRVFFQDDLVKCLSSNNGHEVRGIIYENEGLEYYLRVEKDSEGFILEIFNIELSGAHLHHIAKILEPFNCKHDYASTVIQHQVNPIFISGKR